MLFIGLTDFIDGAMYEFIRDGYKFENKYGIIIDALCDRIFAICFLFYILHLDFINKALLGMELTLGIAISFQKRALSQKQRLPPVTRRGLGAGTATHSDLGCTQAACDSGRLGGELDASPLSLLGGRGTGNWNPEPCPAYPSGSGPTCK